VVYLVGPVVGAVVAVGTARVLRGPPTAQEASAALGEHPWTAAPEPQPGRPARACSARDCRLPFRNEWRSWFSELTTKWLRRGSHRSVPELTRSIQSWIEMWNDDPRPFVWTKTADEILDRIARYLQPISNSGHYLSFS
jgi:hypothetical protein